MLKTVSIDMFTYERTKVLHIWRLTFKDTIYRHVAEKAPYAIAIKGKHETKVFYKYGLMQRHDGPDCLSYIDNKEGTLNTDYEIRFLLKD
jgi:hypothetical protein